MAEVCVPRCRRSNGPCTPLQRSLEGYDRPYTIRCNSISVVVHLKNVSDFLCAVLSWHLSSLSSREPNFRLDEIIFSSEEIFIKLLCKQCCSLICLQVCILQIERCSSPSHNNKEGATLKKAILFIRFHHMTG